MIELKNHVLDHDPTYRREFHLFQRVQVINDAGTYMILYIDRGNESFFLRLCNDSNGDYDYKYVPSVKVLQIEKLQKNDIVSMETGFFLPIDRGYLGQLKLAIVLDVKVHADGHSSWTLKFLLNNEY